MIRARRSSPPRMLPTRIQREMGTRFAWMISSTVCGVGGEKEGSPGSEGGDRGRPHSSVPRVWGVAGV